MKEHLRWLVPVLGFIGIIALFVSAAVCYGETLVQTDTMRLKTVVYQVNGHTIVCHWLENPKLLSGKVNTGLSCVVIPEECPICPKPCPEPRVHQPDNSLF